MPSINFTLNGKPQTVDAVPEMPLLWVLRDTLGMTGTKFGCGMAMCGACTVHINGDAVRSCITQIQNVAGKTVTTIEGLSADGSHPVQVAWMEERRSPVRLLPVRADHGRGLAAREKSHSRPTPISTKPCAATSAAAEPTRHIRAAIHRAAELEGRQSMTSISKVNRRDFFKTTYGRTPPA